MTLRAAVFASGRGSNFQVLAEHARRSSSGWEVGLLVTDREDAPVLERARALDVSAAVLSPNRDAESFPNRLLERLEDERIDFVLLAGYLRLIPQAVVQRFRGRMINLHPALLPSFGGKGMYGNHIHRAVLDAGVRVTGVTVHLVDEEYDRGPILAQWPVPVLPSDTPESLAARIHRVEHRLYPVVADELARALGAGEAPAPGPVSEGHFHFSSASPDLSVTSEAPLGPEGEAATEPNPGTDT